MEELTPGQDVDVDLSRYFQILRRWWWLLALCAVLAAGSAYLVSARMQPVYSASATLLVQQAPATNISDYNSLMTSERLARTYVEMVTAKPVFEAAAAALGLESLGGGVKAELVRDTQLLKVSAEANEPAQAAVIANTVSNVFIAQVQLLQEERYANSLGIIQQQLESLQVSIEETQLRLNELAKSTSEEELVTRSRLETTLTSNRATYASLLNSREQMRLAAAQSADNVTLFEEAREPKSPIRPKKMQNTVLAGMIGLMLAAGVVFLLEYLDDTLKTPDDVTRTLGLSVLGAIGEFGRNAGELNAIENPLSAAAEDYRMLRTNIRFAGVDRPLRTLMITSAAPTEGKTTTLANLGVVMAQAGMRVALVDADLRRPRLHKVFDMTSEEGLTESLVEGMANGRLLHPLAEHPLTLLPSGVIPPNPVEMLGSLRMKELLDELAQNNDMVLVDSPPALSMADAAVLAQAVDGVLMVAESGSTRRDAARDAAATLQHVGANLLGVVLTRMPVRNNRYYYHYRKYYHNGEESKSSKRNPLQRLWRRLRRQQSARRG